MEQDRSDKKNIGYVVGGSLRDNLNIRLTVPPQEVQEGAFVVTESGDWRFFGLITNLELGATDPRFADEQSEKRLPKQLAALLHGQTLLRVPDRVSPLTSHHALISRQATPLRYRQPFFRDLDVAGG